MDSVEEEFSEWEEIQYSPRRQSSQNDTIATPNSPIVQPCHTHERQQHSDSPSSFSSSDDVSVDDRESAGSFSLPSRVIGNAKKRLRNSGIFHAVQKMCDYASRGRAFWSFAPVAGVLGSFLVVSLVYARLVRRCGRVHELKLNRLVLLLKEKDQKIRQLVLQIARLNELLSSPRRVRVTRIA